MKKDTRRTKQAVYVVDDLYMAEKNHQVPSGYDLDVRGGIYPENIYWERSYNLETDPELCGPATISRKFMPVREGLCGLTYIFTLKTGDGFCIEFYDDDDNVAFTLSQKEGFFWWNDTKLSAEATYKKHSLAVNFDMDEKTAEVCFAGVYCGTFKLFCDNLARFMAGYKKGTNGLCTLHQTHIHINYLFNDRNEIHEDTSLPYGWVCENTENAKSFISYYYEGHKHFTYVSSAEKGAKSVCKHPFRASSGTICFEIKYLTKNDEKENVKIALTCGEKECVCLVDKGSALEACDGTILRKHNPYVWQTLNVKADTETGKANIMLNGKKCGEIDFSEHCDYFDGFAVFYEPENGGVLKFTDMFVSIVQPEPEDYPKPPVLPERDERYYTGMNICSLWRNGEHVGWDAISAFHDNLTYLGFYDEGIAEVADWEIKWMVEHGVDCEFYCWYASQTKAPNLKTMLSAAIHDGHFKAKYADYMKLALIWEAGAGSPASPEEVAKYYIPYFEDYFFTDPRYFAIDNVAIMAVYNVEKVARDLGGYDKVREVVEILRTSARKCGFRDIAILTCGDPSANRKIAGVDAVYAYGWGHNGYDPSYQKSKMQQQIGTNLLHVVPTVSVGYNDIAWRKGRYPMITCEDMGNVIDWFKDDVLPSYADCKEEWQRKLMMFSTWNEYGEGTYICPANLNGFGYLNEARKAVTKNGDSFESDVPSQNSLDRIGYLYPKGRQLLSALLYSEKEKPDKVVGVMNFDKPESVGLWECVNGVELSFENGRICGNAPNNDPQIIIDVDIDASKVDGLSMKFVSAPGHYEFNRENPLASPSEIFFIREGDEGFHHLRKFESELLTEDNSILFLTRECTEWCGKIKKIRIDPLAADGRFEIENIKLLSLDDGKIRYETYIDGNNYECHFRTKEDNGKLYVSFEPLRHFPVLTHIYYEWDAEEKTLMIKSYTDKVSRWTIDKDVAVIDGNEVKLSKPVEFFDGLPYLPLDEFCLATGCTYKVDGSRVDIFTNIKK